MASSRACRALACSAVYELDGLGALAQGRGGRSLSAIAVRAGLAGAVPADPRDAVSVLRGLADLLLIQADAAS